LSNELIVSASETGLRIAVLENRRLVELHTEDRANNFAVGDIYLGTTHRVNPGMNAVFVDIGHAREGFLQYLDLGPSIKTQMKYLRTLLPLKPGSPYPTVGDITILPEIDKHGRMNDVHKAGQPVLVQIMKEAISTKGPRLTSQISLAGQYIILLPFGQEVAISRKIRSGEVRSNLRRLLETIRPQNMGIIVRTAAEEVELPRIQKELEMLIARWDEMCKQLLGAKAPKKVLSEIDRATGLIRDMLSIGFDAIITDDADIYSELEVWMKQNLPDKLKTLQLRRTKTSLFEHLGLERQIKGLFGKTVNLGTGAYIVVEHTEALHVFDVNSGSGNLHDTNPEENALRINQEAAAEIARQLRLRDMGGIVVIDFIDQRNPDNKRIVYERLKQEMAHDRARHTILPVSKFGLIQLTRQRVRPEMNIVTDELCPSCGGTGKIQPSILLADEVDKNIELILLKGNTPRLRLAVNPFLAAYLKQGFPSIRLKWLFRYRKWIPIVADTSLAFTKVKYYDANEEEIKLV
jgi:ribonuclease G